MHSWIPVAILNTSSTQKIPFALIHLIFAKHSPFDSINTRCQPAFSLLPGSCWFCVQVQKHFGRNFYTLFLPNFYPSYREPYVHFSNPLLCLLVFYNEPTPVEKGARDLNEDLTKGFELGKYSKYPQARQLFRRITNYIINWLLWIIFLIK